MEDIFLSQFVEKFNEEIPNEAAAIAEIERLIFEDGLQCRVCQSRNMERGKSGRHAKCLDCGKSMWITAGTFFDHTKRPRALLLMMKLWSEGFEISAHKLHKLAHVAYATAWSFAHKLANFVMMEIAADALDVPTSMCIQVVGRRSTETPRREPPGAEQTATMEEQASGNDDSATLESLPPDLKIVYSVLTETPLHFDQLADMSELSVGALSAGLTMLELAGLVRRNPGEWFRKIPAVERKALPHDITAEMKGAALVFMEYIENIFHRISRKYLQRYVAIVWIMLDRNRWTAAKLAKLCFEADEVTTCQLKAYVTPLVMQVPQAFSQIRPKFGSG